MVDDPPATGTASILVVDDQPANLQAIETTLRRLGYAARLAANGPLALEAVRAHPPDLILLDVRMPGMDGYEVCAQLQADERWRQIPVIFLSGQSEVEDKLRAFQAGASDYVTKPFQPEEVAARIRTQLENQRLRREIEAQNARLESTVRERTRELAEANAQLAQLDQAKTDFLAVISHELRTPLGVLFGTLELAFSEPVDTSQFRAYKELVEASRRRLSRLAEDGLLLSSLEVQDVRCLREAVAVDELLAEAAAKASADPGEGQMAIPAAAPCGLEVVGDRQLLRKALAYLLKTGAKFSRPGRPLRLGVQAAGSAVVITLVAEGYGVPAEELPHFFEVLAVGKAIAHGGNLGLAPAVAAQIIRLMHGQVGIRNTAGPGIHLMVSLPRHGVHADAAPGDARESL